MSDRLLVGTRKGLLTFARNGGDWTIARTDFAGIPVSAVLHDRRDAASQDGVLYAALNHGHFGAKLHRSDDAGRSWRELPAPACGTRRMTGRAGRCAATAWWRPTCRPSRPACARSRIRIAWRAAPLPPT